MVAKLCKKKKNYILVSGILTLKFDNVTELDAIDAEEDLSYQMIANGQTPPEWEIYEIGSCGGRVRRVEY